MRASQLDHYSLWAGPHSAMGIIPTTLTSEELKNPSSADDEKRTLNLGLVTHIEYKNSNDIFLFKSFISVGQISDMSVEIEQFTYRGHASLRNFSLGPIYRHLFLDEYFFELGYFFSQQQMTFKKDRRLSFQAKGPILGLGLYHQFNKTPVQIELVYTFQKSYQYKYVNASDFSEPKTIYSRPSNIKTFHHLVGLNLEFYIF